MKLKVYLFCSFCLFCLFCSLLNTTTWHIKQDGTGNFTTIQQGIDASVDADTVLVHPGTYFENIIYDGKNITVASLELTTGNAAYVDSTVIDGQRITSCVCLVNEEIDACLRGFTITNGQGEFDYPKLGGGISIWGDPDLLIQCEIMNCLIIRNYSNYSGGIHIDDGDVFFSGTSIRNNYAMTGGGGVGIRGYTQVTFDPVNRCSIYNNFAATGLEIYTASPYIEEIEVIVDTFTIAEPTQFFAQYYHHLNINPYSFDILNNSLEQVDHDLYVSPDGDDSNSGLSSTEPMKTINLAVRKIASDSLNPKTIHLAAGTYNISENQQQFAFGCKAYVNIIGEDVNSTIIDGEMNFCPLFFAGPGYVNSIVKNLSFINGNYKYSIITFYYCDSIRFENIIVQDCITEIGAAFCGAGKCGNIQLKNVIVDNNQSELGFAGAAITECSFFKAEDCNFSNNELINDAALCSGLQAMSNSDIIIENCTFISNSLTSTMWQGVASAFLNNHYNNVLDNVIINNCLFYDNTITNGRNTIYAQVLEGDTLFFTNNTVVDNESEYTCEFQGNIKFSNNILRNECDYEIVLWDQTIYGIISELDISNNNIMGGEDAIFNENGVNIVNWLEGNIDENPLFFGTPEQPYLLSPLSPCIDAGTPDTTSLYLPPWDLLHNHRVWDGDNNGVAIIDMGCYEFGAEPYVEATQYQIPNTRYQLTNYPNPFNPAVAGAGRSPATTISFDVSRKDAKNAKIEIYNLKGQKVRILDCINRVDAKATESLHHIIWDGRDENNKSVTSGVYMYQLKVDGKVVASRKCLLLK